MSTLELILAGFAIVAFGLPIGLMLAAATVVMLPIAVWQLWTLAFRFVLLVSYIGREEWDRRRARKAGA